MSILDDINALLPDNTTGQIDAADLREAFALALGAAAGVEARVSALETEGGTGGNVNYTATYQLNPTAGAEPQTMQMTTETADASTSTWVRFWKVDKDNRDLTMFLATADKLFIQQETTSANWAYAQVTGAMVDGGEWVQLPVSYLNGSLSLSNAAWQNVFVVIDMPEL